jgi:hypothetical protein
MVERLLQIKSPIHYQLPQFTLSMCHRCSRIFLDVIKLCKRVRECVCTNACARIVRVRMCIVACLRVSASMRTCVDARRA